MLKLQANLVLLLAGLCLSAWPSHAREQAPPKSIHESDLRAASSKRYSELLRLACFNGWRFRSGDIAGGFRRNYEELKLAFIDEGYTILPAPEAGRLIVATIAMDGRPKGNAASERSCFRARWSNE